jgi:hypothetical protein
MPRSPATATRLRPAAQVCRLRLPWESDVNDLRQPQRGCVPQRRVAVRGYPGKRNADLRLWKTTSMIFGNRNAVAAQSQTYRSSHSIS